MKAKLNGRVVCNISLEGIDTGDHPDYCDAHFVGAIWADTKEELTDVELDKLKDDNPDFFYEAVNDYVVSAAEAQYDSLMDR